MQVNSAVETRGMRCSVLYSTLHTTACCQLGSNVSVTFNVAAIWWKTIFAAWW